MPGLAVRGTFSPARAWRPAVVARLARTLGKTSAMLAFMQFSDLQSMSPSSGSDSSGVRGRPSVGGRRTGGAHKQWRWWAIDSAPAGAGPNCRWRAYVVRFTVRGGRPSAGGRRTSCGAHAGTRSGSAAFCAEPKWVKLSLAFPAAGHSVALGCQTAEYGLPNPQLKRTCLRQAA